MILSLNRARQTLSLRCSLDPAQIDLLSHLYAFYYLVEFAFSRCESCYGSKVVHVLLLIEWWRLIDNFKWGYGPLQAKKVIEHVLIVVDYLNDASFLVFGWFVDLRCLHVHNERQRLRGVICLPKEISLLCIDDAFNLDNFSFDRFNLVFVFLHALHDALGKFSLLGTDHFLTNRAQVK